MKTKILTELFPLSNADDLIIIKIDEIQSNIRFANNNVTSSGLVNGSSYTFISIVKGKVGAYSVEGIKTKADAIEAIRKSEEIADKNGVAENVDELYRGEKKDILLEFDPEESGLDLADKIKRILASLPDTMNAGFAEAKDYMLTLMTSSGIVKQYRDGYANLSITARSLAGDMSVWHGAGAHSSKGIDEKDMVEMIQRDLKNMENKVVKPAGRYEVILAPYAVCDMLMYLVWMSSLRDADEGRSMFSKFKDGTLQGSLIGEKLFPENISLLSSTADSLPFLTAAGSSAYASVFDNGLPLKDVAWIKNGVLKNLITTRKYAKEKYDTEPSLMPSTFSMPGSNKDVSQLIKETEHGLLVNTLWYIRLVDPMTGLLTGLTRDGVFVIENGEIIGSTNNFRFNVSPLEMLKNTIDMSKSITTIPREFADGDTSLYTLPYLKVKDFNMSSVSEAI